MAKRRKSKVDRGVAKFLGIFNLGPRRGMAAPGMVHPEDKGVELMEFPTTAKAELDLIRKIAKPIKKKAAKFR